MVVGNAAPHAPPSGTVTFLFSDVEGSTSLLAALGADEYARELELHRRELRRVWSARGGVEIDTQGDSFFVVFARAADAVEAAREAQAALRERPLRPRIGIHTGEPLLTDGGYVGMDVHRAARIASAGHGGQILVSQVTRDLVGGDDLVDLGDHRLKDLTRPERIYQVGAGAFAPLKSLNRSTLPEAAHPLVGREVERRELAELLRRERLVTITGTGGTGKTRLALQLAGDLLDEFSDGVRFVPLASVSDPALVLPAALEALGVAGTDGGVDVDALVVLDNFEHLVSAAPALAELLARPTAPTVLVTSRTPLHLSMEVEYPLDPLPEDAAVELFLERAQAMRRETPPTAEVREICRRLDGLPLALELAAARLKLLTPAALLERLDSRLPLLTRGPADAPERQRTLEATIAWSYDLLDADARRVFTRLSVFAGTFDVEAAEHVANAALDDVATLVDASLVRPRGDGRFLLLETIREFARQRMDADDARRLARRHAEHYLQVAEASAAHLTGADAAAWLARLDRDYGNLRAALDYFTLESPRMVPRLVIALWRFWLVRGRFEEGQTAIERALFSEPDAAERAELLYQLGTIVISRGATERGRAIFQEAYDEFRALGIRNGEARSLSALGHVAADAGSWDDATRAYEAATRLFRLDDETFGLGGVLGDLATVYLRSGRADEARPLALESLELQRDVGNRQGEALALAIVGYAALAAGELEQARAALVESIEIAHELGYLHGLVFALNGLGAVAARTGDEQRSADLFVAAAALRRSIGIDHDPDDVLVADDRRAVLGNRSAPDTELDLDRVVAAALLV
ncbi:MAG TPA: tetratricopeptide repeat protein [Gaiellaceae bacterium]|nr:tetratricopeptide repeat protein [Gaiellaceae bacterium]